MGPSAYMAHNLPEGMEPGLKETAFFDPVNFSFPLGAFICEVEVDPDTGTTEIVQFTFQKSGLKPPTSVEKISTVRRRRSKPLNPSTLVGGGSVLFNDFGAVYI